MFHGWWSQWTRGLPALPQPPRGRSKLAMEVLEDRLVLSATLVQDLNLTTSSSFSPLTGVGATATLDNFTYFGINDGTSANALWRTDGTLQGTTRVKAIGSTAVASLSISNLTRVGDRLFFTVDDGIHGTELWTSDGTDAGTNLVRDIATGMAPPVWGVPAQPLSSNPSDLTALGDKLYFVADDGEHGRELWVSDGTADGTHLVIDLDPTTNGDTPGDGPGHLTVFQDQLYFFASDGVHGTELWTSDGSSEGTHLVKDINPGAGSSGGTFTPPSGTWLASAFDMLVVGDRLYFAADDGTHGTELWRTDGTEDGTVLVKDINPGVTASPVDGSDVPSSSAPAYLTRLGASLYFVTMNGESGYELWKSDGTEDGTTLVKDLGNGNSSPRALITAGNKLFFLASTGPDGSEALWQSGGTPGSTRKVVDLNTFPPDGLDPTNPLLVMGNNVFFAASTTATGRELWMSDGTQAGTRLVKDIRRGKAGSGVQFLGVNGNQLLFAANDGKHGLELWKSVNGRTGDTRLVDDINTNTRDAVPAQLLAFKNQILFVADDGIRGAELWMTNGKPGGMRLVRDINTGFESSYPEGVIPASSNIRNLTKLGAYVYFVADDGVHGEELWRTDGTTSGTRMVKDINPGSAGSAITSLTVLGRNLYFVADDGIHGRELWITDGTSRGTRMVEDINYKPPLPNLSDHPGDSGNPGIMGGPADPGTGDPGPPPSDPPTTQASDPQELTVFRGRIYFSADDGLRGRELWVSDGTTLGTRLVADINPGISLDQAPDGLGDPYLPDSSNPSHLTVVGKTLFFAADDGVNGVELWKSDGTERGTVLVRNIARGSQGDPTGSFPDQLTAVGNTLYFTASDNRNGLGLWKSDGTSAGTVLVRSFAPSNDLFYGQIASLTNVNGRLYFTASTSQSGLELWVSDGHWSNTKLVKDIFPGTTVVPYLPDPVPNSSAPSNLMAVGNQVYFYAEDANHGRELWRSNGTSAGTVMVEDVRPGKDSSAWAGWDLRMLQLGGYVYFPANDGAHGLELWKTTV